MPVHLPLGSIVFVYTIQNTCVAFLLSSNAIIYGKYDINFAG